MKINKSQIESLEKNYRTAFINSIAGFRQAVLVGTKSNKDQNNLAIFNSLIHLGANPALFGLMSRPDVVPRHTLQNILDKKQYSLNYVSISDYEKAHQTSARYGEDTSEFDATNFTTKYIEPFITPFVEEAVVKIAMQFEEKIDIKINGTVMIIGSIQYIELNENLVSSDGFVNLAKAEVLVSCGLDAYFSTNLLGRLSYAKPDQWPFKIQVDDNSL
jgi:flavin reductase (DIM6/NTAB) family NADH-FMN oxidoreductase RutF